MFSTKICQINNFIQDYLEVNQLNEYPAIEISDEIPDELLQYSYDRPGYPLTRLMRQGKIIGAEKETNNRWIINRVSGYENKYSVKQVSILCGYKTTQPIYNLINSNSIPFEKSRDNQIYFIEKKVINWIKASNNLPLTKPTISVFDIYYHLKALQKMQSNRHDKKNEYDIFWLLLNNEDIKAFLTDRQLQINEYDYSLEQIKTPIE